MRLLHIADAHLDSAFASHSGELRKRLREASREAFRRAVDLAVRERVHALLVAGDLFDGERLTLQTEGLLLEQTRRLSEAGVQVVYATGNHDPGREGLRAHALPWPPGVHVVRDAEPREIVVRDRSGDPVGRVTAAGHPSSRESADLSRAFPRPEGILPEVALLHTQVVGAAAADSHEPYAPSERARLAASGHDYWALGHVHLRQMVSEDPPVAYPGNLQGRNPRETGAKGGLLVELRRGRSPRVEFRSLATLRWEVVEVAGLSGVRGRDALLQEVRDRWREARGRDPGEPGTEWIVRFELSGGCPMWRDLREEDPSELGDAFAGALDLLAAQVRCGRLRAPRRSGDHRNRRDVLGTALRLVEEIRAGSATLPGVEEELAGLGDEGPEALAAYLGELVEGAEEEILDRMLRGEEGGRS